ncbi:MAG: MauE/DoxX family redox-associated membrane protein, partial [Serratia inhibens]|uniref:MauE/DoxX family redox-associated membrane protein n=1 Tax=Serratia inhibens TaxID=2338073 RepID=UPI003C7E9189
MVPGTTSPGWAHHVGSAAAFFLGLVLLVAAWAKAIDPDAFIEQIRGEGLAFFGLAAPVAFAAIAIEIALGTALVLGMRHT